ncbi:MAG: Transcription elongation factor GreA [Bacteroidetes bacterium ADurb.Bin028]|jgi:transcription elongation factor GreA|nr:MAG: Transcription elongation factor GreA [Bacteroidetes bacterium ADurb.Bin028]
MSEEISYLTEEGLNKLKDELDRLVNVERGNISRQIAEARDKGDLSENAEYDAAKEAQGLLEMKISKLQEIVRNARVLDPSQISTDAVQILNKVKLKNVKTGSTMEYTIVAETEANLKEKKISVNTPIAKGLLGRKVGDVVEIEVPNGIVTFEILNISI